MSKVLFAKGTKASLPTSGQAPYKIFFTTDTYEMYVADASGVPQRYNNEILNVTVLPSVGIEGKIYVYNNLGEISLQTYYNGTWIDLSSNGSGIDQSLLDLLLGLKEKTDVLTYTGENITRIDTTYVDGTPSEFTEYSYDVNGNVLQETIHKQGKVVTNTFTYSGEDITQINTTIL